MAAQAMLSVNLALLFQWFVMVGRQMPANGGLVATYCAILHHNCWSSVNKRETNTANRSTYQGKLEIHNEYWWPTKTAITIASTTLQVYL